MLKYTIEGFSQAYAMTLKKEVEVRGKKVIRKIDCTDLVILRWFVDFYPKMKKVEVNGVQYAWLTHKKLMEDLPLIDITKRAFIERMKKLVDFEILTYQLIKEGGTFSVYGFGKNYEHLISGDFEGVVRSNDIGSNVERDRGMRSNDIGVVVQPTNKDYSIKDTSIKDNSITIDKIDKIDKSKNAVLPTEIIENNNYSFLEPKPLTKQLLNCDYIEEDDMYINEYNNIFDELLYNYDLSLIRSALNYFTQRIKWSGCIDEYGNEITNKLAYFKTAILSGINRLLIDNGEIKQNNAVGYDWLRN